MSDVIRPRVLILGGKVADRHEVAGALRAEVDVDRFDEMSEAMNALRHRQYDAIFADVGDFLPLERGLVGQQSTLVLETIGEGVGIFDAEGRATWCNSRMRSFSDGMRERVAETCLRALGDFASMEITPASAASGMLAPAGFSRQFSMSCEDDRYFELMASPIVDGAGRVRQIAVVVWETTEARRMQLRMNAIDKAGRELAKFDVDLVRRLEPGKRLDLLQDKIIHYSRDLLSFDHFAIRLVNAKSGKLDVIIAEGLPESALDIELFAKADDNGICGRVAATGQSYICQDTAADPLYIRGIDACRSSLTVPLRLHDSVIGVFNIESDAHHAFSEADRQFAEIFAHYVAVAVNMLDLLVAERASSTGQLADNAGCEMAQPLNDIVTEAEKLMDDYIGDGAMRDRLKKIVSNVTSIRDSLKDLAGGRSSIIGARNVREKTVDPLLEGLNVLIADDDETIRRTIGEVLGKFGCKCILCKDGFEAMTLLDQLPFDLVLSDINMPEHTGYEIFAQAKRQQPDLPVILMTGFGYDPDHSIVRASKEGLARVLFKPFKVDELLADIRSTVEGNKAGAGGAPQGAASSNPVSPKPVSSAPATSSPTASATTASAAAASINDAADADVPGDVAAVDGGEISAAADRVDGSDGNLHRYDPTDDSDAAGTERHTRQECKS